MPAVKDIGVIALNVPVAEISSIQFHPVALQPPLAAFQKKSTKPPVIAVRLSV